MVFSSLEFIFVFLASVLAVYYLVPPKARNIVLLLFSLVFYGWGEPVYVFLMIATITVDYICGYIIGRDLDSKPKRAKVTLIVSIVINLALLGVFKYYDFFAGTLNSLLGRGVFPTLGLTLPIGISFYTFQALSYVIDVYRRDARVQKNIAAFGTYVTLFPQLIAGPIVRYADVDDQLRERTHSLTLFASGCRTFICGLAKKILLANAAGAMWNSLSAAAEPDALGAWLAIVFYTFQIYFDFSGYSDMAIGLGKNVRVLVPRKLLLPLRFRKHHRILAKMAHLPFDMVPRIRLHPARRKPQGRRKNVLQSVLRMASDGTVARCKLELRPLGTLLFRASCNRKDLPTAPA